MARDPFDNIIDPPKPEAELSARERGRLATIKMMHSWAEVDADEYHADWMRAQSAPRNLDEWFYYYGLLPCFLDDDGEVQLKWLETKLDAIAAMGLTVAEVCAYLRSGDDNGSIYSH